MKDTRRDFIKKMALLAGSAPLSPSLTASIEKALSINPELGSTFYDAEHVVLLMQENRSFDHAFGTLRGVRGFKDPRVISQPNHNKVWMQTNENGETYVPFRLDIQNTKITWMGCLPHSWTDQTDAYNQGKMNRWLDVKRSGFKEFAHMPLTMGYYTREDIPFNYALADAFTICDQHFCSSLTGTNPNRLFFWSGTLRDPQKKGKALVWNGDSEFSGKANWKTFPERLSELEVNWKVYQNEISSSSAGYSGEVNSWLGNFGCNALEYFPQYKVQYSQRYKEVLTQQKKIWEDQLKTSKANNRKEETEKLSQQLKNIHKEIETYTPRNVDNLPEPIRDIHQRAFVTNQKEAHYMELETMSYFDGKQQRKLRIPKGDILYQFRKDVESGKLPTVSWLVPPQLFSDHPDSPWFGSWYVSEVLDILTKNPEVWKKTIFILTYDENDGYFDHIPPFTVPSPFKKDSGKVSEDIDAHFEFVKKDEQYYPDSHRESAIGLGYRVPLIIASPWTRGGWVNSQVFDHTSPLQFLEKFISHKIKKPVKELNIGSWRRAVCGDLTSAFRKYKGEKLDKLTPLDKKSFLQQIHKAKFKNLPTGFTPLSPEEIRAGNVPNQQNNLIPQQESGTRPSNALPYELYVNGYMDKKERYRLEFKVENNIFNKKAAGAAFIVYHRQAYKGEIGSCRNYAISPGKKLEDSWDVNNFEEGIYNLEVHGPNGFYRNFKGNKENPLIRITCDQTGSDGPKNNFHKPQLRFACENLGPQAYELQFIDNSYGNKPVSYKIQGGETYNLKIDVSNSHQWYDISIQCKGFPIFKEQYAGRIETGIHTMTDPLLG